MNRRGLFKVNQHPRCFDCVLLRLPLKCLILRRLQRQAPMKVDPAECCCLIEKGESVACKRLSGLVLVSGLPGEIEPEHHSGVLIQDDPSGNPRNDLR